MGIGFGCTSKSYIGRIHFSQKWKQWQILLGGRALKITVDSDCSHEMKKTLAPWKKNYDKPRQHIKKQSHHFADKGPYSQSYAMVFPVVMYWCENWTIKKVECWRTDAFNLWCWRRLLRVPWTVRSNQSILKEINWILNDSWIFTGRTDVEAEAPILWPPDAESQFIGKDHDAGKDWGQEEKRGTEDEMVGWHHRLNGHEFEQTQGASEG